MCGASAVDGGDPRQPNEKPIEKPKGRPGVSPKAAPFGGRDSAKKKPPTPRGAEKKMEKKHCANEILL